MLFTTAVPPKSVAPRATEAEAAKLYATMATFPGAYKVEGDKLTYKIEVSWNQNWNGTESTRILSFPDGKRRQDLYLRLWENRSSARASGNA